MNLKEFEKRMEKLGFSRCNEFCVKYNTIISFAAFKMKNENVRVDVFGNENLNKIYFYIVELYDSSNLSLAYNLDDLYELKDKINDNINKIYEVRKLMRDNFEELYDASGISGFEYAVKKYGKIIDEEDKKSKI